MLGHLVFSSVSDLLMIPSYRLCDLISQDCVGYEIHIHIIAIIL